ncbi:DUF6221 family protein [Prauserella cavernicola]|uniref:Uncharacterized protein n=1 Tax=Prauserella cavernicola TaxID=2800127 RepID=A0A934V5G4_9PSEU|nr:DUF6221 family protein [Prauserella cavernicola]MBK1785125.1 hypothetical protein [Prauserella cavernicola]
MAELTEFLRARLDEDENSARLCSSAEWTGDQDTGEIYRADDDAVWGGTVAVVHGERLQHITGTLGYFEAVHIARHDPAAVLDDIESKRRILDEHAELWRDIGWLADGDEEYSELPVCGVCVPKHSHFKSRSDVPNGPCRTVRLLALPYASHSDYREEWRP